MSKLHITVPLVPPSVNAYVRHTRTGRHYITKAAKAYKQAVAIFAAGRSVAGDMYCLDVCVYLAKGQRGDGDNMFKCVADGLVEAGVIHSDAAIKVWGMKVERDWSNPRTEIWVQELAAMRREK
jgi:crossover junction endodeoxyribonuclease RusA